MDFYPNEDQRMLRDSVARFAAASYAPADRVRAQWSGLAELGLFMLGVPEACGGVGGGAVELALAAEQLGGALSPDPFVAGFVLPAMLLTRIGPRGTAATLLDGLMAGGPPLPVAIQDAGDPFGLAAPQLAATRQPNGAVCMEGHRAMMLGCSGDGPLIATAVLDGGCPALVLVPDGCVGLDRHGYSLADGSAAADLSFRAAGLDGAALLARGAAAADALDAALDIATTVACAEMLGGLVRALDLTIEHLATRRQFGRPLSEFQVLQHRTVDMLVVAEECRAILHGALAEIDEPAAARHLAVSACKVKLGEAAVWLTGTAVHQHGGIGITSEYPIGHFYRRALVFDTLWGGRGFHMRRLRAALGGAAYRGGA